MCLSGRAGSHSGICGGGSCAANTGRQKHLQFTRLGRNALISNKIFAGICKFRVQNPNPKPDRGGAPPSRTKAIASSTAPANNVTATAPAAGDSSGDSRAQINATLITCSARNNRTRFAALKCRESLWHQNATFTLHSIVGYETKCEKDRKTDGL